MAPRTKAAPAAEFVIALETFVGDASNNPELRAAISGAPDILVKSGDRLRADHPAVKTWPQNFAPDGLDDYALAQRRRGLQRLDESPDLPPATGVNQSPALAPPHPALGA